MGTPEAVSLGRLASSWAQGLTRVAFVGSQELLDAFAPAATVYGLQSQCFPVQRAPGVEPAEAALMRYRPHVTVVFDPPSVALNVDRETTGVTLGVLVDGVRIGDRIPAAAELDRVVSFDPARTGECFEDHVVWRAIPPPVSDAYFADVRALHRAPRAMTLGASTEHREAVLMPAKHHHDVLQLIHGVSGDVLVQLLGEYDVGIFVSAEEGGGFGHEALVHLAAGQLLLASASRPTYGLERNVDYLHLGSADALVWMLERLGRFPEMHQRVRVRGRVKAEQFRASRVFARLITDVLADIEAFGSERRPAAVVSG